MLARIRTHLPVVGFACALVLLSSAGITSYVDARRMARFGAEIGAAHAILEGLGDLSIAVERIVTTTRVFLLTGDEEFAASVEQSERRIVAEIAELRELLDSPDLLADLAVLETLTDRRIRLSREYVDIRRRVGVQRATEWIQPGGEQLTTEIRELIASMEQKIESRLDERRSAASANHFNTLATMVVFGCISLVALAAAFLGFRRQARERAELERQIVVTGELERDRIARDLHDGVGQELAGISLRLGALANQLSREGSVHAETAHTVNALAQASISEIRRLSRSLSPAVWSNLGICGALKALAREVDAHSKVRCAASCASSDDVDDAEVSTQLFRIAQEAVNNALRHSHASEIELRYGREGDAVYLEVLDNGVGIPKPGERTEGLGLRSMGYRARMVGGHLEIKPRAGGGTEVRCAIHRPGS